MKLDFRSRLLTTTLLVGAGMLASPAFAQDAPAATTECPPGVPAGTDGCNPPDTSATGSAPETTTPQEGQTTVPSTSATGERVSSAQDIVITGTRIPQPNLTSSSPVTVLSSQEVKLQGTSRTEDLINSLPQSFAAQGSNISNGASGTATVNLRGLGSNRSLVLVNGRRLQPGDTGNPVPDINFVPTQLIKRVDVLTGGASSVYGADAVGGVVNFIMDNTFTGIRLDAQASIFMHNNDGNEGVLAANAARGFRPPTGLVFDGGAGDLAAVVGAAFDDGRGHAQAYATYRRQRSVLQSGRDYSFCALQGVRQPLADANGRNFNCGGSGTSATGTFYAYSGPIPGRRRSVRSGLDRPSTSGRTTSSSAPTNATRSARSRIMRSARASSRTSKPCSWTIGRFRRSLRRATSSTPTRSTATIRFCHRSSSRLSAWTG